MITFIIWKILHFDLHSPAFRVCDLLSQCLCVSFSPSYPSLWRTQSQTQTSHALNNYIIPFSKVGHNISKHQSASICQEKEACVSKRDQSLEISVLQITTYIISDNKSTSRICSFYVMFKKTIVATMTIIWIYKQKSDD